MTKTHRHAGNVRTREYNAWRAMNERCHYEKHVVYKYYGALGIVVCDRWRKSFEAFFADVGPAPSRKHTIDRYPNKSGNYEPGNVRWALQIQQNRNKSTNLKIDFRGETMCLTEACERAGVSYIMVKKRLRRGWDQARAFSEPAKGQI